jgi:hypothetical protein
LGKQANVFVELDQELTEGERAIRERNRLDILGEKSTLLVDEFPSQCTHLFLWFCSLHVQ